MMRRTSPRAYILLAFLLSSIALTFLPTGTGADSITNEWYRHGPVGHVSYTQAQTPPPTLSGEVAAYPPPPGSVVVTQTGDDPCTTYSFTVTTTAAGPYQGTFTATGSFTLEPMTPDPLTPNINYRVTSWTETFTLDQPVTETPPQPVAHLITGTKQLDPGANSAGINVAQCSATLVNPSPVHTTYQATITGDDGTFTDSGTAHSGIAYMPADPSAASFFENFNSSQAVTTPAPPTCTKIAFATNRDGNFEVYVMNPDGSGQVNVTSNLATDTQPAWSPDGTKLAFATDRDGNYEIYVMNSDGSNLMRLTNDTADDQQPDWSPDGTKIAFFSGRDGVRQIYVMNADATNQTNLSNNLSKNDEQPHWSPDGNKITFSRSNGTDGSGEVYVMDATGLNQMNLTNSFAAVDAPMDWSPDGTKILFASNRDQLTYELYTMNADGSGTPARLTNNTAFELLASWSPDGTQIAFQTSRDNGNHEIYVMDSNGSNPTNLTNNASFDTAPSWGRATPMTFYLDADEDGFGDPDNSLQACSAPTGYVADNTDCNDGDATVHPGAAEVCNEIDDDCDGQIDEGLDQDGDGVTACSGDCDDTNDSVYPGAPEICNGIDDDCDGAVDEDIDSTPTQCGVGACHSTGTLSCQNGQMVDSCIPGTPAPESCNGLDDNCDGQIDEGVTTTFYRDADGDGYGNPAMSTQDCSAPPGYVNQSGDCNDSNPSINPGASEVCNGVDDNCNGQTDEGLTCNGRVGTVGYWVNHPEAWCVQMITVGCVTYTKAQAIAIMKQSTSTDMTYAMAAQLIVAKLNINCAGSNPSCVSAAIAAADNWLCTHPVGSKVKASSSDWKGITSTYNTLVKYNEGKLCAPPRR